MKPLEIELTNYAFDPARFLGFEDCLDNVEDGRYFFAGVVNAAALQSHLGNPAKRIYRLDLEEPNRFFVENVDLNYSRPNDNPAQGSTKCPFEKIFTLCPYSSAWLNEREGSEKHIPVFFPFNEKFIPAAAPKIYDVIYTGHLVSPSIERTVRTISKFNYRFVSGSASPLVTDGGVDHETKLKLMSQTRVTIVQNLLYLLPKHVANVLKINGYQKNGAFKNIHEAGTPREKSWLEKMLPRKIQKLFFSRFFPEAEIVVPQLKSRVFEAAFARSLILCRRDEFNVIERYFTPGREFVYYEDATLEETLREILKNFGQYEGIVENAYQRAVNNYTTRHFAEKFLR